MWAPVTEIMEDFLRIFNSRKTPRNTPKTTTLSKKTDVVLKIEKPRSPIHPLGDSNNIRSSMVVAENPPRPICENVLFPEKVATYSRTIYLTDENVIGTFEQLRFF